MGVRVELGFGFGLGLELGLDIARVVPSPVDMEAAVLYSLLTMYYVHSPLTWLGLGLVLCTLTVAGRHGGSDDRHEDPATDESVHGEVAVGEGAWLGVGVGVRFMGK